MEYCLDSTGMKKCDKYTIERVGIPSLVLMERAALAVAEEIVRNNEAKEISAVIFAGTGNNGGDGIAVGRILSQWGVRVEIRLVGEENKCSDETIQQLAIAKELGIELVTNGNLFQKEYNVIVDALFGIGLSREVTGEFAKAITDINSLGKGGQVYAVDVPSGIHADTGKRLGMAVKADYTVTFQYAKPGLYLLEGRQCSGQVLIKDIGIIKNPAWAQVTPSYITYQKKDLCRIPKRSDRGNKGSFGRVAVFAGSYEMAGAVYFAADAAYRSGCGLVEIITHERNRTVLMEKLPEAVFTCYSSEESLEKKAKWQRAVSTASAIVIGPGLGTDAKAEEILSYVLKEAKVPCVIDADAINILACHKEWLRNTKTSCILTPHIKELSRLNGVEVDVVKEEYAQVAVKEAKDCGCIIVAKNDRTIVADEKGNTRYLNLSGCNGMAGAGSGDVLAGMIGGLLAQGMDCLEAACMGVYTHGLAGEAAAEQYGNYSMKASDIINNIHKIIN